MSAARAVKFVDLQTHDEWNAKRRSLASGYLDALRDADLTLPVHVEGAEPVYHLFVIRSSNRDALADALSAKDIGVGIYCRTPVRLQPACSGLGCAPGAFPAAERLASEVLSQPMHPFLTVAEVDRVAEVIRYVAAPARSGTGAAAS